jgi:hypothetical protein
LLKLNDAKQVVITVLQTSGYHGASNGITFRIKKNFANVFTLLVYKPTRFSLRGWNSGYCTLADLRPDRVEVPRTASS